MHVRTRTRYILRNIANSRHIFRLELIVNHNITDQTLLYSKSGVRKENLNLAIELLPREQAVLLPRNMKGRVIYVALRSPLLLCILIAAFISSLIVKDTSGPSIPTTYFMFK